MFTGLERPGQPTDGAERLRSHAVTTQAWADKVVFALILVLGGVWILLYRGSPDFLYADVFYADAARSLLQHGIYGINGHRESNQPPGLSAILAGLCLLQACGHVAILKAMQVFETLGMVACYAILRREVPKAVAASICLLLMTSPIVVSLVTQSVFPNFPFFLTTMCALLIAAKYEAASGRASQIGWGLLLALLCAASLLIASAGIALLGGMVAVIGCTFMKDRGLAVSRLKGFLPILIVSIAAQGVWSHRKADPLEWPMLPGYPAAYVSQLKVISGNHPELGLATWSDVPVRVIRNAFDQESLFTEMIFRHWISPSWASVLIAGPLILIVTGWGYSVWKTGGRSLLEWYFAGYEFIYLLWPWTTELRFFLPVAPLAGLYLWRGLEAVRLLASKRPRVLGLLWLPVSIILATASLIWMRALPGNAGQAKLSSAVWLFSAILAVALISRRSLLGFVRRTKMSWPINWPVFGKVLLYGGALFLIAQGLAAEFAELPQRPLPNPPDVDAGLWLRSHVEDDSIVMATDVPTVFHYSRKKLVWFPPISKNPQVLMDGIRRLKVEYVVEVYRTKPYYLPPDQDCFGSLAAAYPDAFQLAFRGDKFNIFRVVNNAGTTANR